MADGRRRPSGERRDRVRPAKVGRTSSRVVAFCIDVSEIDGPAYPLRPPGSRTA